MASLFLSFDRWSAHLKKLSPPTPDFVQFTRENLPKDVEQEIVNEYCLHYESLFDRKQAQENASNEDKPATAVISGFNLLKRLQKNSPASTMSETFESELQRWFAHQDMFAEQFSRDVGKWFSVNKRLFPRIELMARDFIGVTSTSVPSEVAFSQAGVVVSKSRARLDDGAVTSICELQSFLSLN